VDDDRGNNGTFGLRDQIIAFPVPHQILRGATRISTPTHYTGEGEEI